MPYGFSPSSAHLSTVLSFEVVDSSVETHVFTPLEVLTVMAGVGKEELFHGKRSTGSSDDRREQGQWSPFGYLSDSEGTAPGFGGLLPNPESRRHQDHSPYGIWRGCRSDERHYSQTWLLVG